MVSKEAWEAFIGLEEPVRWGEFVKDGEYMVGPKPPWWKFWKKQLKLRLHTEYINGDYEDDPDSFSYSPLRIEEV